MADKMMRIAGRGEDGKARPFLVDNDGLTIVKSPTLETNHHLRVSESGNGEAANVKDFNSITFHVAGTFRANITFQANSYGDWWQDIRVEDNNGNYVTTVDSTGFYKADVSGYKNVRVVVDWISGTGVTVTSVANLASTNINRLVGLAGQNKIVDTTSSDSHIGLVTAFYGGNNTVSTNRSNLTPVNYTDFSKKSIYVKNDFDTDMRIIAYNKHINEEGNEFIEKVETDIFIPKNGGTGKLSYIQYPDLNEPFNGLTLDLIVSGGSPTSGNIKIHWLGGNE